MRLSLTGWTTRTEVDITDINHTHMRYILWKTTDYVTFKMQRFASARISP